MKTLNELKTRATLQNSPKFDLSNLESSIVNFLKGNNCANDLTFDDVQNGLIFYSELELISFWSFFVKDYPLAFVTSETPVAKHIVESYLKENPEYDTIIGFYNLETKFLQLRDSVQAQILDHLNIEFLETDISLLREELSDLEMSLNCSVEVILKRRSLYIYEMCLSEQATENNKIKNEFEKRKTWLSAKQIASVGNIVMGAMIFLSAANSYGSDLAIFSGGKNSEAQNAALKAGLMQTGLQNTIDGTQKYVTNKAEKVVKDAGAETPMAVLGFCGKVIKDKTLSLNTNNDFLLKNTNYAITLTPARVEVGVKIGF